MAVCGPLWLVLNEASGSNDASANAALADALAAVGMAPARTFDCAQEPLPDRAALEAASVAVVACHTGDGTLNALIPSLEGWSGAVLVLPGGTTNLLAKALHGDRPADAIVAGLPAMRRVRRSCIRSAAGTALIEVLAGPGAKWSDVREELRNHDVSGFAGKAVEAVRESAGGATVAITSPPLGDSEGYAGVRLAVEREGMRAQGFGAETFGDYLRQGLALLRRDFREGPHAELGLHRSLTCRARDNHPIELMIDGERRSGASEMQFSLAELDVDLLAG